ncbi:Pycsar system effector family protein [Candidatus Frankia alpina]|nr:Pycsar system effector family protein [Candidatus Frankia alpina]
MTVRTDLIASMRSEAARSDSQVGIILAGAMAALGFVVTSHSPVGLPVAVAVFWWAGMAAGVAGVISLGWSLCPSIPRPAPPAAVFHCWHVLAADDAGTLEAALDRTPVAVAAADRQVAGLAAVVAAKWSRNRWGLRLLGLALVLLAVAGLIGAGVAR